MDALQALLRELAANLYASTSGTDADLVVKLIDVYPEEAQPNAWDKEEGPKPGQYERSVNGYELPIAMEGRRGLYLASYERPQPLPPGKPVKWNIPLRDHDHVFLKGHRLMVQVQSTWFPIIDRNPQKFVPSIYEAKASDYVKAVPDQVGRFVPQPFIPLGTDGYGFSDVRPALRRHFEVDAASIVVAVLDGLAQTGDVKAEILHINTKARPRALQIALLIPLLAALLGLWNGFRMTRLPDPEPSAAAENLLAG